MTETYSLHRRAALAGLAASLVPLSARGQAAPSAAATLRAAPARRRLLPDGPEEAELWLFEGPSPVPVLRAKQGEDFAARLVNDTPAPLTLHWQGLRGPNAVDGVGGLTQEPVPPGGSFEYRFRPPDPGLILIRPMVPGRAGEAAGRGLCGLLVVEEREPPKVAADHALVLRDWRLERSGALAPFGAPMEAAIAGRLGNRLSLDGQDPPRRIEAPAGSQVRLRLANGSNARILRIRFDDLKVYVAAVDGQPTDRFEPLRASLPFPPGTRYDLLLELGPEAGRTGRVVAMLGDGVPLVEIAATAPAGEPVAPANLPLNPLLPPEIRLQNALRRDLAITGGATRGPSGEPVWSGEPGAIWKINGAAGGPGSPPLFTAKRGQPVVLALHNQTGFPQPIHLHGHVCRLLHALDDGWEPYWLDTVQIAEGRTARIAFLADNPGKWAIGSSVLERLDTGLWGWFEVT
ncbi:multicopper oxidase family protein [Enterovirga aerilata]|uniref:Multicopper oxidase family protein n=1 Tax=Enterovirga aerilata TaxID=2730920 RepID=A0A849I3J4_9HYPH|nr:multicopper oxidase family protein [Enterovirga sp. DB1703]NNM71911.1 multicopper oxidase family protein [Enterovirga sp. DB1703]